MTKALLLPLLAAGAAMCTVLSASGQTPYNLSSTSFIYVGAAGDNASASPTEIYTTATAGSASFSGGTVITGTSTKVNGAGLNPLDGFLYAVAFPNTAATNNANLYRIGSDGIATQIGVIPSPSDPSATLTYINTTAGMMDNSGNYWFMAYTYSGNPTVVPYSVSNFKVFMGEVPTVSALASGNTSFISTVVYNQVDISDPALQAGFTSFLNNFNYLNPGYSDGGIEDFAINPLNNKIYSYMSYPDPSDPSQLIGRPIVVDPATWAATPVGATLNSPTNNGTPNREIAGDYFDASGNLYVIFTDGSYGQINLATGAVQNLQMSTLPLSSGDLRGDLASNPVILPLPLVLESFTGTAQQDKNVLRWQVGSVQNVKEYIIERSADGQSFEQVGVTPETNAGHYIFADNKPMAVCYYRLKIAGYDGRYTRSDVIKIGSGTGRGAVKIYPAVISGNEVYIQAGNTQVAATLTDMAGKVITRYMSDASNNIHTMSLPLLPAGMYLLTATDTRTGEKLAVQRIVKQ
ncbi:T9SS type A sorting domain-containing protein [Chitinophagaceae bacterium MMS25-I14]